jgi:hypothetical protein
VATLPVARDFAPNILTLMLLNVNMSTLAEYYMMA